MGDSSDSIPGVKGIGEKGAVKLLTEFTSLEHLYNQIDSVKPEGTKQKLIQGKESAFLSKQLATLRLCQTSLVLNPWTFNKPEVMALLGELNMKSAFSKIGSM